MNILSQWIRSYVPGLTLPDRELAEALTLRGIAVEGIYELGPGNGSLFEMDITTNRVDAMNHYGIAREAAAIAGLALAPLDAALPPSQPVTVPIKVSIEAPELCGRFTARSLSQVHIQSSSGVVTGRFALLQQKLISNAVDATNFVTLALGHPTHAFDRDKLEGGIIVRRARAQEKLKTLDGIERVLDSEDLVIADEKKAIGLAGVMGGWDTMITAETKNILVEAAWFDPATVRRSSKRHGLHTDASHRFERGADFNAPPVASAMVSQLILQAGGHVEGEMVDVVISAAAARTALRPPIGLTHREVRRILGATEDGRGVEQETTESVLQALGCTLHKAAEGEYQVTLPSWRLDLEREIDLIEEIARVYGYNRFANTLPTFSGIVKEQPDARKEAVVRQTLLGLGWNEALSSTFCSATDAVTFAPQAALAVALGNPLNEEAGMLRPSLLPGMLTMLAHNLNRNVSDIQLFENGTVFSGGPERVDERPALSLGASGSVWSGPELPAHAIDFYDLKGAIEEILEKFAQRSFYFDTFDAAAGITPAWLHPGRSARAVADGLTVAWFGQLNPAEAQQRKLRQTVYAGEIYLDRLYRLPLRQPIAPELSRYQPVERDFSFVFADEVRWQSIDDALHNLHIAELTRFAPREIFRASQALPRGHYSILIRVTFQALERTLREEELQSYSQAVMAALESLGGRQRA
ncbi:MAG: phenylalanine--tRNA ligase subunit beta [Acidobacteriaceae bacterium]